MTARVADVEAAKERMKVTVHLTVTHDVWVKLEATTDQSFDELKAKALREFQGDQYNRRMDREKQWRTQFDNRANVEVGSEQVSIAAVTSQAVQS